METKKDSLDKVIKDLTNMGRVEKIAITSRDGLVIDVSEPGLESFVAMSATMFGAAETMTIESGMDLPTEVIIETSNHKIIAVAAGSKALLVVQCNSSAGLGLIRNEMKKSAGKVKTILE